MVKYLDRAGLYDHVHMTEGIHKLGRHRISSGSEAADTTISMSHSQQNGCSLSMVNYINLLCTYCVLL